MTDRTNNHFIDDILSAINSIFEYTHNIDYDKFINNKMIIDAVIRNFEIIGEAAKNISDDIRNKYPDISWKELAGMRDKLIHNYFGISHEIIWDSIKNELIYYGEEKLIQTNKKI